MVGRGLMGVNVEIKGGAKLRKLLAQLSRIGGGVKAGFLKGSTTTDGKSIPMYAAYNEYGTSRIPARPFMRTTAKEHQKEWIGILGHSLKGKLTEKTAIRTALGACGQTMVSDIQATIQQGSFAPNAESTIKAKQRKGKTEPDHPLIDTGQMLAAVSSEVYDT